MEKKDLISIYNLPIDVEFCRKSKLLREVKADEAVYFVHSFMAMTNNSEDLIANCLYGGISVPAIVGRDNVYGCQFHPEKSGEVGLRVLRGFLSL